MEQLTVCRYVSFSLFPSHSLILVCLTTSPLSVSAPPPFLSLSPSHSVSPLLPHLFLLPLLFCLSSLCLSPSISLPPVLSLSLTTSPPLSVSAPFLSTLCLLSLPPVLSFLSVLPLPPRLCFCSPSFLCLSSLSPLSLSSFPSPLFLFPLLSARDYFLSNFFSSGNKNSS